MPLIDPASFRRYVRVGLAHYLPSLTDCFLNRPKKGWSPRKLVGYYTHVYTSFFVPHWALINGP